MILQITSILLIFLTICSSISTSPPSFHPKNEKNKAPIKYEYSYKIASPSGGSQVAEEQRDGIYALGRYYVSGAESKQKVEYLADNWGFHPYVEYSHVGPHSKSMTQIAYGEEAVKALHNSGNYQNLLDPKPQALKLQRVPTEPPIPPKPTLKVIPTQYSQPQYYQPPKLHYPSPIQHQQPQYILEPPQPQPNQIPIYFIQSGYSAPPHQSLYPPENNVQTTILVPVKSNIPEYVNYPQPSPLYMRPTALPMVYEPIRPKPNLQHHSIVLQNVQENIKNQLLEEQEQRKQYITNLYGNKINAKLNISPTRGTAPNEKLIESTRELVTAQDVININESFDKRLNDPVGYVTASTSSIYATQSTAEKLSENPIVVQDVAENHLPGEYISSTETSVKTVEVNSIGQGSSTEPTILVTPRSSLGTGHLAPINAAIQLQSIEQKPEALPPTVKSLPPKSNVVVEIQKSVPYYLGKFEFVHNAAKTKMVPVDGSSYKYDVSAETAENFELGKTILSNFGTLEQPSSTKQPFQDGNNLDQHQAGGQLQYQVVPAQSLVRDAPIKPAVLPLLVEPQPTILAEPIPLENYSTKLLPHYSFDVEPTGPLQSYAPLHQHNHPPSPNCDHHNTGTSEVTKPVPTLKPVANDVFPTSKPIGTIIESYNAPPRLASGLKPSYYKTIDLYGTASKATYGLVPPMPYFAPTAPYFRPHHNYQYHNQQQHQPHAQQKKFRHARQSFEGNLRIEYGFMPPLRPSVEIDEHGVPVHKEDS